MLISEQCRTWNPLIGDVYKRAIAKAVLILPDPTAASNIPRYNSDAKFRKQNAEKRGESWKEQKTTKERKRNRKEGIDLQEGWSGVRSGYQDVGKWAVGCNVF